jgi:hypothetical protein
VHLVGFSIDIYLFGRNTTQAYLISSYGFICYTFRPFLRSSSGMSIQKSCKEVVTRYKIQQDKIISSFIRFLYSYSRLRWSIGSVLAFGTQVRGFKPGRSCWIFKGKKILSTPSFGGEVKPSVPCRRFAARKRSLELRGSRILDEIYPNISRPRRVPPSAARGLSRRWQ